MTAEKVKLAIEFALKNDSVRNQIQHLESKPKRFVIFEINGRVVDYHNRVIRVIINFNEKGNPNNYSEDTLMDIQITPAGDYKILSFRGTQFPP